MDRKFSADSDLWSGYYNPSYNPEKCGLKIIARAEESGLSYEYNTFIVWQDLNTLLLYWGDDAGCSCPEPFENFHSLSTMNEILGEDGWNSFENSFKSWSRDIKMNWTSSHAFLSYVKPYWITGSIEDKDARSAAIAILGGRNEPSIIDE